MQQGDAGLCIVIRCPWLSRKKYISLVGGLNERMTLNSSNASVCD